MNNNLFKKLNEQMEINSVKSAPILESEVKEAETRVIFNDYIKELRENTVMAVDSSFLNEDALFEDFREFLDEEGFNLNEEVLDEGKFLNNIRWKLAKYALKFLKEETIDEIIKGYYGEEKAKEKLSLKKKEKVKIVREIADRLPDEKKDQVANNEAARKLERSGILSAAGGIAVAGLAAGGAVLANNAQAKINNQNDELKSINNKDIDINATNEIEAGTSLSHTVGNANISTQGTLEKSTRSASGHGSLQISNETLPSKLKDFVYDGDAKKHNFETFGAGSTKTVINTNLNSRATAIISGVSGLLSTIATVLGGAVIGAIVTGAIGLVTSSIRAGMKFHQANAMRANEIMQYLLSKKSEEKQLKE